MAPNWRDPGRVGGIAKDRHALYAGRDLLEQFQPFPAHAEFEQRKSGDVAARPRQACDETGADRIGDTTNTTGICGVACLQRRHGESATDQDEIRRQRNQLRRVAGAVNSPSRRAVLDPNVAAHDPAQLPQALTKGRDGVLTIPVRPRTDHEHADPPHALGLLRARRERPRRRRAAETAMNSRRLMAPPRLRDGHRSGLNERCGRGPMSALGQKRTCAAQKRMSALPPIADIKADNHFCPLSATSDQMHRSKQHRYSITSSARASSVAAR